MVHRTGALVFLDPDLKWEAMKLGAPTFIQTYTLSNSSDQTVKITNIELSPGTDSRIHIAGGTCQKNMLLKPKASATIHISINPSLSGMLKEQLKISHNGFGFPLQALIELKISDLPTASGHSKSSYLSEETTAMDRARRVQEQDGHRRLAHLNARDHSETAQSNPEGALESGIMQNPWLNSQRFDGVDPNLNPEPPLNSTARTEFDNERREQEMEKQLRLGNMPKFSSAPKPPGAFGG